MSRTGNPHNRSRIKRSIHADQNVETVITDAVTEVLNTSLCELPPLQKTVDGDALNTMFRSDIVTDSESSVVVLSYAGCIVRYYSDETVIVVAST